MWDKCDQTVVPQPEVVAEFIDSPLWKKFLKRIEDDYGCRPKPSYSSCSMLRGWNLKLAKGGRALCTVYPMEGSFSALVSIGPREAEAAAEMIPACTKYVQELYAESQAGHGGRWLLIETRSAEILNDLLALIALRMPPRNGGGHEA